MGRSANDGTPLYAQIESLERRNAELESEVERLSKELASDKKRVFNEAVRQLRADDVGAYVRAIDAYYGVPCEQIRHAQEVEGLQAEIDRLREGERAADAEIERLRAESRDLKAFADRVITLARGYRPVVEEGD